MESPTSDFYGGKRPGNNLYANSLVAVDLDTGKPKWHFQFIHHEIWDYDMSSAPLLMDITVDGKPIKAVANPSKMGMLYVFDRITGKPVWPIPERKVEKGNVPGEWYSPTQPIPSKPKPYARTGTSADELIDFTPALRAEALELVKNYKLGPIYTPPVVSNPNGPIATFLPGTATGGTNWPGGSFNPENHTVYTYALRCLPCRSRLWCRRRRAMTDLPYVEGQAGQTVVMVNAAGADQGADAAPAPKRPRDPAAGGQAAAARCRPVVRGLAADASRPMPPSAPSIWTGAKSSGRSRMATRPIHPQQSGAEGAQCAPHRPDRLQHRQLADQDLGDCGRCPGHHHAGASARRHAARL